MLPSFEALIAQAHEVVKPYRWLVKQSRCRACGNVHEKEPRLMRETENGWSFQAEDDGSHNSAPVVFEEQLLAWCEHCHSPAAQELTKLAREALDMYSNSTTLAIRLQIALRRFELAQTKEHFHHA